MSEPFQFTGEYTFGEACQPARIGATALACASTHRAAPDAPGGLVPFSTSDTREETEGEQEDPLANNRRLTLVDNVAGRIRRMKSGVMTAARLIFEELAKSGERWQPWMITPTYRPGEEWAPHHITGLVKCMRTWAERQGFKLRYVWVAEIQEGRYNRGALLGECVHYHLLVWIPKRFVPPKPDKQGWWSHGMTQRLRVNRPLRYILKYASKGDRVKFPKGLRLHACGGLNEASRDNRIWWLSPRWVRAIWSDTDKPRRAKGGGFVSRVTKERIPSIFKVMFMYGYIFISQRHDIAEVMPPNILQRLLEAGCVRL